MIDELIEQLESPDPTERREAIIALGRTKNPAALKHLATIFRSDPQPELRELARKAGVYIQQNSGGQATSNRTPSDSGMRRSVIRPLEGDEPAAQSKPLRPSLLKSRAQRDDDPPLAAVLTAAPADSKPSRSKAVRSLIGDDGESEVALEMPEEKAYRGPVRGRQYNVSKADRDRARTYVESAMTLNIRGENDKAMRQLTQALKTDPNLINDGYFNSLAASVTEREGDDAINMIVDGGQRQQFIKEAKKEKRQKRVEKHMETVSQSTGRAVGFEMLIYLLIVIIGPLMVQLVTVQSALRLANEIAAMSADAAAELEPTIEELAQGLSAVSIIAYVITGVASAAGGFFGLLIMCVVVHFAATKVFGGTGTISHLLTTLLGFFNKWLPIYFFLLCVFVGLFFVLFPSPILLCALLPIILLTLYLSFNIYGKIGEAYDMGLVKGCLSYMLASFVISAVMGLIGYLIAMTFGAAIQAFYVPPEAAMWVLPF